MDQERFHVTVNVDELRAVLKNRLRSEYSGIITETIIGHLNDTGRKALVKALMGIDVIIDLKPMQKVWINSTVLPSWKWDKEKSLEKYGRHGWVVATIVKVSPYAPEPIEVLYNIVKSDDTEERVKWSLSLDYVRATEPEDPDLPF